MLRAEREKRLWLRTLKFLLKYLKILILIENTILVNIDSFGLILLSKLK